MKYLLDTHAVLWAAENDPRLGADAVATLRHCTTGDAVISDVTLLEIAMLIHKRRIRIAVSSSRYLSELQANYPILGIDASVAATAFSLKLDRADPFDRIIVATARRHALPLVTRDEAIKASGLVPVIW